MATTFLVHVTAWERDILLAHVDPQGALDDLFRAARVTGPLVCLEVDADPSRSQAQPSTVRRFRGGTVSRPYFIGGSRVLFPGVNRRTLQRDLKSLVDNSLLREIGTGPTDPNRHYVPAKL